MRREAPGVKQPAGPSRASHAVSAAAPRYSLVTLLRPRGVTAREFLEESLLQGLALVVGLGAVLLALVASGESFGTLLAAIWEGSLSSEYAIRVTLGNAVPLLLIGVAVWLAFAAGLFNIGGEGQLYWGGLTAVLIGVALAGIPVYFSAPIALIGAMVAGALWAGIAVAIKTTRGAHEVISTIMLNYVAVLLVNFLINDPLKDPANDFPATERILPDGQLSVITVAFVATSIVLLVVACVWFTRAGLSLRAVGAGRDAAARAGVPVNAVWLIAFSASGALAGLAGGLEVLSVQYLVSPGWSLRWGSLGLAVGFLATRNPLFVIPWSFTFGILQASGPALQASAGVPSPIIAIMFVAPLITYFMLRSGWAKVEARLRRAPPDQVGHASV